MHIRLQIGLEDHLKIRANCNKLDPTLYIPLPFISSLIALVGLYIVE